MVKKGKVNMEAVFKQGISHNRCLDFDQFEKKIDGSLHQFLIYMNYFQFIP